MGTRIGEGKMNRIVVALPAFNEQSYIGTMVLKCKQYTEGVVVVNDGSTDNTAELAKEAGAEVISHNKNLGYGATIKTILSEAKKKDFDALVILDADNQHFPEDIPDMVKPIYEGYDLAIGSRRRKDIPKHRYVGGKCISIFLNLVSRSKVVDTQCGFRAYSPKAVRELELEETGMAISSEMLFEASRKHLKTIEVPISIRYTKDSSTQNPFYQGFYTLWRIAVMAFKKKS